MTSHPSLSKAALSVQIAVPQRQWSQPDAGQRVFGASPESDHFFDAMSTSREFSQLAWPAAHLQAVLTDSLSSSLQALCRFCFQSAVLINAAKSSGPFCRVQLLVHGP